MRGNLGLLSEDELKEFEQNFQIIEDRNSITTITSTHGTKKVYDKSEPFCLRLLRGKSQKIIKIQPIVFNYKKVIEDMSIFRIQNAINQLIILSQEVNLPNILLVANRNNLFIKEI